MRISDSKGVADFGGYATPVVRRMPPSDVSIVMHFEATAGIALFGSISSTFLRFIQFKYDLFLAYFDGRLTPEIQEWRLNQFHRTSFQKLGLSVQLGHPSR